MEWKRIDTIKELKVGSRLMNWSGRIVAIERIYIPSRDMQTNEKGLFKGYCKPVVKLDDGTTQTLAAVKKSFTLKSNIK
jgi:hypothetical protein